MKKAKENINISKIKLIQVQWKEIHYMFSKNDNNILKNGKKLFII